MIFMRRDRCIKIFFLAYTVNHRMKVLFRRAPTNKWRVLNSGELLPISGEF